MNKQELEVWMQGCIDYYNATTTGTKLPDLKEIKFNMKEVEHLMVMSDRLQNENTNYFDLLIKQSNQIEELKTTQPKEKIYIIKTITK
jgi:hypothetical protein